MKTEHLSEEQVQQYALVPETMDAATMQHVLTCNHCTKLVDNYKLLFTAIKQVPAPAFEFDLAKLVIAQIPAPVETTQHNAKPSAVRKQYSWLTVAAILACFAIIGAPFYYFRNDIQNMISGLSVIVTYLIVISVVLIAGFQAADEYRKYMNRINSLDLYK